MLGKVSRMRVSSITRPSSSGTLKSTRMKTLWSFSGKSRMESLDMDWSSKEKSRWLPHPCRVSCDRVGPENYSPLLPIKLIRSRTRQEYPHSLSYQETTLTRLPIVRVEGASKMDERSSPLKSEDTSSFSS